MTRIVVLLIALFITQAVPAATGSLFNISEAPPLAGANGNTISLTLCLNGNAAISCQNYTVTSLNLSITPVTNHSYPAAGIKINSPGYTLNGCRPSSNGYCLFATTPTQPANITVGAKNVAPLLVNAGPPGVDALNTAFVTLTICEPGTNNCQAIDNIQVDTGSTGIRIIDSVMNPNLNLPAEKTNGSPIAECYTYVSSSVWGSVKLADVYIAGEVAHSVPIQVIADHQSPYTSIPGSCPGPITDTVVSFGANGIVGVNNSNPDCGTLCTNANPPIAAFYYSCDSTDCHTEINLPLALQVPNVVTFFDVDNNGTILQLPSIPTAGKTSVVGALIFGIGTQSNNQLNPQSTILPSDSNGNFKTEYNGNLHVSYTDSGTNDYEFPNDGPTTIPVLYGYYNPSQPLNLQATMIGHDGSISKLVNFTIVSEAALASDITAALIASPTSGFVWGLSFFFGHNVYTAIDKAPTIYGPGPYIAF